MICLYIQNTPIRPNSTDVLRYPCGQIDPQKPDYADLFIENDKQYESLYISPENTTSSPQSTTHLQSYTDKIEIYFHSDVFFSIYCAMSIYLY